MAYQIGQIIAKASETTNSSINNTIFTAYPSRCKLEGDNNFYDECLILQNTNFIPNNYYYVHCKIKKFNTSGQTFKVKLIKSNGAVPMGEVYGAEQENADSIGYQFISTITIPGAKKDRKGSSEAQKIFEDKYNQEFLPALRALTTENRDEFIEYWLDIDDNGPKGELIKAYYDMKIDTTLVDQWQDIELIFTPSAEYNTLLFQLSRTAGEDLKYPVILYEDVKMLNNQITETYNKIGIQSHPGLLTCINGEKIIVGRSGLYEIKNGIISVNFFATPKAGKIMGKVVDNQGNEYENLTTLMSTMAQIAVDQIDDNETLQALNIISKSLVNTNNNFIYSADAYILDYMYNLEVSNDGVAAASEEA